MSSQPATAFVVALDTEIASIERAILDQVATQPTGPNDPMVAYLKDLKQLRLKHHSGLIADVDRALSAGAVGAQRTVSSGVMDGFLPAARGAQQTMFRSAGRKQSPERQRALAAARQYLLEKNSPVKTNDIYQHLLSRGLNIGGSDPVNNLSAALHHATGFRSHGKSGWTLETQVGTQ
jgi:hypothetical protein